MDGRSGGGYDIYGARATPGGVLLDVFGIAISTANNDQQGPAIAFDGANYLVAWMDLCLGTHTSLPRHGVVVTPAGVVLCDPNGIFISAPLSPYGALLRPALAFSWNVRTSSCGRDDRSQPSV